MQTTTHLSAKIRLQRCFAVFVSRYRWVLEFEGSSRWHSKVGESDSPRAGRNYLLDRPQNVQDRILILSQPSFFFGEEVNFIVSPKIPDNRWSGWSKKFGNGCQRERGRPKKKRQGEVERGEMGKSVGRQSGICDFHFVKTFFEIERESERERDPFKFFFKFCECGFYLRFL